MAGRSGLVFCVFNSIWLCCNLVNGTRAEQERNGFLQIIHVPFFVVKRTLADVFLQKKKKEITKRSGKFFFRFKFLKFFSSPGNGTYSQNETYEIIKWWDKAVPCRLSFECFVHIIFVFKMSRCHFIYFVQLYSDFLSMLNFI